ncbi:MAG: translation initiation factor IF-6, partial [Thermoplasmata archaeon]|nr:translation initiation factor IF-6 [Thermoplasmata archaeon]
MLRQLDFHGNSSIGVFCVCSDAVAFVPEQADDEFIREMKDALEVDVERLSIDGSPLLGSLIAMNSKGAVVADFALSEDLKRISSWVEVGTVEDNLNAIGNNLIANDNGILAHPDLEEDTLELISSILRVPVVKGTMGGMGTIGANAVVNRKGLLCHPKSTEEERKIAEKILKV